MDLLQLFWDMMLSLVQLALAFWPLTAVVLVVTLIRIGIHLYKTRRYAQAGIADIDKLGGKEFEEYLEIFFKGRGYQVQRTSYQGDYGADLILQRENKKIIVQAKRYTRRVGIKAVQEAVAAKDYYHGNQVMVVTNSYFTPQAESLAKANQVELWNRDTLVSRLLDKQERTTDVSAAAALGTPKQQSATESPSPALTAPICATCGKLVSARVHEYCLSHDDIFNGLTYCYEHQQAIRTTIRLNEKQRELSAKM